MCNCPSCRKQGKIINGDLLLMLCTPEELDLLTPEEIRFLLCQTDAEIQYEVLHGEVPTEYDQPYPHSTS